jgi:16S rRNA (adenine1518-N6/adenine1519-N6)-dimethyltransferase
MDIYDARVIRDTLRPLGFSFSKARGQNFLTDPDVPRRMVGHVRELAAEQTPAAPRPVLEIGPGFGALTEPLLDAADPLVAVEVDRRLAAVLEARYAGRGNFTLLCADALKLDLDALARERFAGGTPLVAANLPYAITSPLLEALVRAESYRAMVLMVQREVALRLAAGPGTADYGSFTVFVRVFCDCRILFDVPPEAFVPRPAVSSSVIQLTRRDKPLVEPERQNLFFRIVRASFAQRRKTLRNALSAAWPALGADNMALRIQAAGVDPNARGETLGIEEFARLSGEFPD